MANPDHVRVLRQGSRRWNQWRRSQPETVPDLSGLDFGSIEEVCFIGPDLSDYDLARADLRRVTIRNATSIRASFEGAYMVGSELCFSQFSSCNFTGANLRLSRIGSASFAGCEFDRSDLAYCSAEETEFSHSRLVGVDLSHAQLVRTRFVEATVRDALVFGIAAWDLELRGCSQSGLIVTPPRSPEVTVDDLELAQFVHLMLNNERLRDVIETVTSKVVLILGRFIEDRKAILDGIRRELRTRDLVPILFDFERPASRSFIETASTLAHLARFVIADFTEQGDVRREVQHIATSLQGLPIVPLLHESEREIPLTLQDLSAHASLLPLVRYACMEDLLEVMTTRVVEPALEVGRSS